MPWTAHIDGGSRGNPGPAGAGVVIADPSGHPVFAGGFYLGRATNNHAEYQGLLHALELLQRAGADDIELVSDSELMVRQINGQYRVKAPQLKPLYEDAITRLGGFRQWRVRHVLRHLNSDADRMANEAMDAADDVTEIDLAAAAPVDSTRCPARTAAAQAGRPARVAVTVIQPPKPDACPAGLATDDRFVFTSTTPPGLCVEACASIIQPVLNLLGGSASGRMKIRCPKPGCEAEFRLERVND